MNQAALELLKVNAPSTMEGAIELANELAAKLHAKDKLDADYKVECEQRAASYGMATGLLGAQIQRAEAALEAYCKENRPELFGKAKSAALGVHRVQFRESPGEVVADDAAVERLLEAKHIGMDLKSLWMKIQPSLKKPALLLALRTPEYKAILEPLGIHMAKPELFRFIPDHE